MGETAEASKRPRIVILGGGFAGVYTALALEKALGSRDDFEIVLVNKENYFVFQPMLPEVISGTIGLTDVVSPLRRLLRKTDIHIREIIKYTNYKRFGAKTRIIYKGEVLGTPTPTPTPKSTKPPAPTKTSTGSPVASSTPAGTSLPSPAPASSPKTSSKRSYSAPPSTLAVMFKSSAA